MKDGTHPFELAGNAVRLFFVGICQYNEVLSTDFKPMVGRIVSRGRESSEEQKKESKRSPHKCGEGK